MQLIPKINGHFFDKNSNFLFSFKNHISIYLNGLSSELLSAFQTRMKKLDIKTSVINNNKSDVVFKINPELDKEAYNIDICQESILIHVSANEGAIHALTTLYQLLAEAMYENNSKLRLSTFSDYPKYQHRGLLVDISRNFIDINQIKKVVEEMALYKLNVLHLHFSDDQGYRIESNVFPLLNTKSVDGLFYTKEQVQELCHFARLRGINVIPEIDIPGHMSAILSAYPHLSCFEEEVTIKEGAGVFDTIMCAGKDDSYHWICRLLDEIVELFPANTIHIGGDEAPKTKWKACPHCNAKMQKENLNNFDDLQGLLINRISEYLSHKGKSTTCWNDALKADNIGKDITVQYWVEMAKKSFVKPYFDKGNKMVFSNLMHMYFDYPHCVIPLRKTYDFEPMVGNEIVHGSSILGVEGAIWTERVPTPQVLEHMISTRIQALSEAAWSHQRDYDEFLTRLSSHINKLNILELKPTPLSVSAIEGDEAKEQAEDFLKLFFGAINDNSVDMGMTEEEIEVMTELFLSNLRVDCS